MELIDKKEFEYKEYIDTHVSNVNASYYNILRPYLVNCNVDDVTIELIDDLLDEHDWTKYGKAEFEPYRKAFYPVDENDKCSIAEFDIAWNHHQKANPHHWQYWCLIEDGGKVFPLDMPFKYICEMLCDWSSFQYIKPGSTANKWYSENSSKMMLSEITRTVVEKILKDCPEL